jgi:XTP/dITP diphosphohydrolase
MFATRNDGKVVEITALLRDSAWSVERMPEEIADYEETGDTFADNARGKALFAAAHVDMPVLADDSGLEIDALGGEPGVRSARYIDAGLTPAERNAAVLDRLGQTPKKQRSARFVCHLVFAFGTDVIHETTGVCEGSIGFEARGNGGFGYDPIFVVPELGASFAEISREHKSALSHRGKAVRAMAAFLRTWKPR